MSDQSGHAEGLLELREQNIQAFMKAMDEKYGADSWSGGITAIIHRFEAGDYADRISTHIAKGYVDSLKRLLPEIEQAEQNGNGLSELKRAVAELQVNSHELSIIEEELNV